MDLWISRPSGRSLQWDLISQWFLFFNPHTTLPAGITRKFIANILLPKSRQIHPNVDWSFSAPSLTQVCIFFWISCPPTKCALSKLVFQTHLFHDVHPVQLSQNWKAPSSGSLVPKTQKSHHPCYSTGHTALGSSESFHVVPYSAVETSSPSVPSWSWRFNQLLRCFFHDLCGFQVAKNVPRTMANAMWIFP